MLAPRPRRSLLAFALGAGMAATAHADALSDQDLARYGFGETMVHTLRDSEVHEPPRQIRSADIPPPVLGSGPAAASSTFTDKDIPEPTVGPSRLILQGGRGQEAPYEGPTRLYQGSDGKEMEGTFKEVENFFFRPNRHFDRFVTMNENDTTGLIEMFTGEIDTQGNFYGRVGVGYTDYHKSFGSGLPGSERIEQLVFPISAMWVAGKDLEIGTSFTPINEESYSFPLISDYTVGGIRDVKTTAKYRFLDNPEDRVSVAAIFSLDVGVENTVTRVGSNGVDYLMALAITKRTHNMGVHAEAGWLFANGLDRSNNRVPDVGIAALGVDFQTSPELDWILEVDYTDLLNEGERLEIIPGLKWKISDRWRYDLGVPLTAVDTMAQGFYYRVTTGFQFKF